MRYAQSQEEGWFSPSLRQPSPKLFLLLSLELDCGIRIIHIIIYRWAQMQFAKCCIFRPVFRCCALQKLVEIFINYVFCVKKPKNPKKQNICSKILLKTGCLSVQGSTLEPFHVIHQRSRSFLHSRSHRKFGSLTRVWLLGFGANHCSILTPSYWDQTYTILGSSLLLD